MALSGGSVLYDAQAGCFKLWYRTGHVDAVPAAERRMDDEGGNLVGRDGYKACYATSADGRAWDKPSLGLYPFDGSRDNNILPPMGDGTGPGGMGHVRPPNLIKDYDDPDPERRYKMAFTDQVADSDGDPVSGDHLHYVVSWRGSIDLSRLRGGPVQLCFELKNAALYAFQFRCGRTACADESAGAGLARTPYLKVVSFSSRCVS